MRKNECFIPRLKIFRKSSIVFLLLAMLSLSITGCGSSKTAVTSSDDPSLRCKEIKDFSKQEVSKLWPEILRFENPHTYYVDLSSKLWNLKQELLLEKSN